MLSLLNTKTFQGYLFAEGTYTALKFYIYVNQKQPKPPRGYHAKKNLPMPQCDRVSHQKVYPTLKVCISHFLSTKSSNLYKNITLICDIESY